MGCVHWAVCIGLCALACVVSWCGSAVLAHGADYRVGSGNRVRGFRHSVLALYNWLSLQHHAVQWPSQQLRSISVPTAATELCSQLLEMMQRDSAAYEMHTQLVDVVVLAPAEREANHTSMSLRGVPRAQLDQVLGCTVVRPVDRCVV